MSYLTANGIGLSEVRLVFPGTGAWHADLVICTADAVTDAVTIDLAGTTFTGTVQYGGPFVEANTTRVVAGAGGFAKPCTPKFYQGATLGAILTEILAQGVEVLSSTVPAALRNALLLNYATTSGTVGANVRALLSVAAPDSSYRFLPDGTFWFGPETFPAWGEDYQVVYEAPQERRIDLGFTVPTLTAGQSVTRLDGSTAHVARVETVVSSRVMRGHAWYV